MKNILLILLAFTFCTSKSQYEERAKQLVGKATQIAYKSMYKASAMDSCLLLVNQAIQIDEEYFPAYLAKSTFLAVKKDIENSIKNSQKMIELRPEKPFFKIQLGSLYDLKNDTIQANKYYDLGLKQYKTIFQDDKSLADFDLRMEYVSALETKGNLKEAQNELDKLDKDFPNNEFLKAYHETYQLKTKQELKNLWENGGE